MDLTTASNYTLGAPKNCQSFKHEYFIGVAPLQVREQS